VDLRWLKFVTPLQHVTDSTMYESTTAQNTVSTQNNRILQQVGWDSVGLHAQMWLNEIEYTK
jgi:hypothetical protein